MAFENLGRNLKIGTQVKVLAKPWREFKEARVDLPLIVPQELVGQVGSIDGTVLYHILPWIPSVQVRFGDKRHMIEVTYLRRI